MDTAQVLSYLHAQRDRIVKAIAALEELGWTAAAKLTTSTATKAAAPTPGTERVISAAARKEMSEAAKERWAKRKRAAKRTAKKAAVVPVAATSAKTAPTASPVVKKVGKPMSAATKKKLALAAKARWAAKKASAKTTPKKAFPVVTATVNA